jgi:hypothetical protein
LCNSFPSLEQLLIPVWREYVARSLVAVPVPGKLLVREEERILHQDPQLLRLL